MVSAEDKKYMRRCIELAVAAEGMTYPNPMVASVIVHKGIIIGEGFHLKAGEAHAEVNAINSVRNRELLRESTLYVNLEPCSHWGKTPPCADFIISHSIPRVVVGTTDSNEKVAGRGIARLREAGCEVVTGVEEEECRFINRRFFTWHLLKRPYIILKWAASADGYLDLKNNDNKRISWISGKPERVLAHRWRAAEQAILAGAQTIRADNPGLDVRDWGGISPQRVILSGSGNIIIKPGSSQARAKALVFTRNNNLQLDDADSVVLPGDENAFSFMLRYLHSSGIQSLLVEGGAGVLNGFIESGLWDEARVFTGRVNFVSGTPAPQIPGIVTGKSFFAGSSLTCTSNPAPSDMNSLCSV